MGTHLAHNSGRPEGCQCGTTEKVGWVSLGMTLGTGLGLAHSAVTMVTMYGRALLRESKSPTGRAGAHGYRGHWEGSF